MKTDALTQLTVRVRIGALQRGSRVGWSAQFAACAEPYGDSPGNLERFTADAVGHRGSH
jgi:hypothetical protein